MWKRKLTAIASIVVLMLPAMSTGTTIYIPYVVTNLYGCVTEPAAPFVVAAECHTIDEVPTPDSDN